MVVLARYLGVRVPSEIIELKWGDVNWDTSRITIRSPKTRRHGKGLRPCPIFPEVMPYLQQQWDDSKSGDEYVITECREARKNMRTRFERIIERAGLKSWPRLWQNLRSTRATELVEEGVPSYVCAAWLGHTEAIANKHYRQVRDEHFERAVQGYEKPYVKSYVAPTQNPTLRPSAMFCDDPQEMRKAPCIRGSSLNLAAPHNVTQGAQVPPRGCRATY
jgi:integrase